MPGKPPRRKFGAFQKARIFFACLPDEETAMRIHALAQALKSEKGLTGNLILPKHLHVTLFHLGDWAALPQEIVALAKEAAAQVEAPAFEVTFQRTESFRNRTGIHPFVLTGDKDAPSWRPLHTALGAALKKAGLGGATHGVFLPHVTLAYDGLRLKPSPVAPIAWRVRDFVLVHSQLGKTAHIDLGRWNLAALR
jgi:2'-5' RNA ligase